MAIETNNNLLKLNQTSGTSSAGSTQTTPYMSATDKALKSGASVFNVAKSPFPTNSSSQATNGNVSTDSTKSQTATAKAQTTLAENGAQQQKESKNNIETLTSTVGQESKATIAQIKSAQNSNKQSTKESDSLNSEITSLQEEVASLSEGANSNPFGGGSSATTQNSVYSLNFGSTQEPQQSEGLLSSPTTAQGQKQNPNQSKIDDLNAQIGTKTASKTAVDTTIKTTANKIKTLYTYNANKILVANTQVKSSQAKSTAATAQASSLTDSAQATQAVGAAATALGSALALVPPTAAAGAALITAGTAANTAGSALGTAASIENGDSKAALSEATKATNLLASYSKQNKETQKPKTT